MMDKLDNFRPPQDVLNQIKDTLVKAGVPLEDIPVDWVEAIVAAMMKWQTSSPNGLKYLSDNMGFNIIRGEYDVEYELLSPHNGEVYELDSRSLFFYNGALYKGSPIKIEHLSHNLIPKKACESCGVWAHCTVDVRDPRADRLETFCNSCINKSESLMMSTEAQKYSCKDCSVITCTNNPNNKIGAHDHY